jgi:hypothetical protein
MIGRGGGREGSKEMRNNDPYILPLFRLEAFALFNGIGRLHTIYLKLSTTAVSWETVQIHNITSRLF